MFTTELSTGDNRISLAHPPIRMILGPTGAERTGETAAGALVCFVMTSGPGMCYVMIVIFYGKYMENVPKNAVLCILILLFAMQTWQCLSTYPQNHQNGEDHPTTRGASEFVCQFGFAFSDSLNGNSRILKWRHCTI